MSYENPRLVNHAHVPHVPRLGQAVRQTWLGDYVEEIARWAMSGPESVPLFIAECLAFEKLPVVVEEVEGPPVIRIGEDTVSAQ